MLKKYSTDFSSMS